MFCCSEKEITGGTIKVVAKYGVITILDQSYDVCDILKEVGKQCPIPAGVCVCALVYMCVNLWLCSVYVLFVFVWGYVCE